MFQGNFEKANKTDVLAPWGLSLNLGQTWDVLHCTVWKIICIP